MDIENIIVDIPIPDFLNESADDIHKRMIDRALLILTQSKGIFFGILQGRLQKNMLI